jgi:hypothetical protein
MHAFRLNGGLELCQRPHESSGPAERSGLRTTPRAEVNLARISDAGVNWHPLDHYRSRPQRDDFRLPSEY